MHFARRQQTMKAHKNNNKEKKNKNQHQHFYAIM
jgi:hypothetical protein